MEEKRMDVNIDFKNEFDALKRENSLLKKELDITKGQVRDMTIKENEKRLFGSRKYVDWTKETIESINNRLMRAGIVCSYSGIHPWSHTCHYYFSREDALDDDRNAHVAEFNYVYKDYWNTDEIQDFYNTMYRRCATAVINLTFYNEE